MNGHGRYAFLPVLSSYICSPHKCLVDSPVVRVLRETRVWAVRRPAIWHLKWNAKPSGRQVWSTITEHRLCLWQTFLSTTFQNLLKAAQHVLCPIHHDEPLSCQVSGIKTCMAPPSCCGPSDCQALILQFLKELQGLLGLIAEFNLFVYHRSRRPICLFHPKRENIF